MAWIPFFWYMTPCDFNEPSKTLRKEDVPSMIKAKLAKLLPDQANVDMMLRAARYFLPYKKAVILATVAMVISGLCAAATAWLVKPVLDDIFIKQDETALLLIPIFFVVITIVKDGTRLLQNYYMQVASMKVLETIRGQLFAKILYQPLRYYEKTQTGDLMSRIINDVHAVRMSLPALVMLVRQVITIVCLIGVAVYQNAALAFWALIVLPLAFYPFVYFGKRMRKLSTDSYVLMSDFNSFLVERLSGIRVVKAFCTEKKEMETFGVEMKRFLRLALKSTLASEFSSSTMEVVGALGIALVIWFGGMQVVAGHTEPGTFFSFITALVMMYEPLKKLSSANLNIQGALAGGERIFSLLDDKNLVPENEDGIVLDKPFQELTFNNVTFGYNEDKLALKDVSFSVKSGERIALVGPSGAGKTTFVNLIPRFYHPQGGDILLNGKKLNAYALPSLRRAIAVVSQDNFLFNTSIRDNITYGMTDISEEMLIAAAKAAFAHDFILETKDGYDTIIGERGVMLSGGQKQRITIARALVKNAPLLILDEATSALDSEAERVVQLALDNLMQNRTSIVIAHRLSTIIGADRILVMDHGKIMAEGKHETLLQTSPLYNKLYTTQYAAEADEE